jgi:phosphomannomutase
MQIRFGTDGWRAIIAEDFTFFNLARVAQAHAQAIKRAGGSRVLVGFDSRFASDRFALRVAEVMRASKLEVRVSETIIPTPALSLAVRNAGADAGVMITASHNPSAYNGYKIKGSYGGSATPELVALVEHELTQLEPPVWDSHAPVDRFDVQREYFQQIAQILNLEVLRQYSGKWFFDAMGGAGAGWLSAFAQFATLNLEIVEIRHPAHPLFYGANPEPIDKNLEPLMRALELETGLVFGVATDGDADRLGAVTAGGKFFNSHQIFVVLLAHLARKGLRGRVIKTVSTSSLVELLAQKLGFEVLETPVGFKYITNAFLEGETNPDKAVLIGGEESGGLAVMGHVPERDGLLNSLLLLEAVVSSKQSIEAQFKAIERDLGVTHAYDRIDFELDAAYDKGAFLERAKQISSIVGYKVRRVNTLDGVKLEFEGFGWLMFRASGTEPMLRVYCEAQTSLEVTQILKAARDLILNIEPSA